MNNFTFRNPTKLVFGKDSILELPKLLPSDAKILLTFGGGSVKRNGVYEAVISQLSGFQTVEFWGIEPNPKVETWGSRRESPSSSQWAEGVSSMQASLSSTLSHRSVMLGISYYMGLTEASRPFLLAPC